MIGKKILKNRIRQLEEQNKELLEANEHLRDLNGTFIIEISEKNEELEKLEITVKNQKECIKKLEASLANLASNSDEKTCITSSL